jgi:hypothetical protein
MALLASALGWAQGPNKQTAAGEFRISGVVRDASTNQSLPGVRVELGSTRNHAGIDRSVLTGPDGRFTFEHLAADKYQLFAEGVNYPLQGFEQHEAPFLTGVVVGPDATADKLIFRLQRGSAITGMVTDESNEPVRDAQVYLFRRGLENGRFDTHFLNQTQTNDLGQYKFGHLLKGTYFVAVWAQPWFSHSAVEMTSEAQQLVSPDVLEQMNTLNVTYPLTFYSGSTDAASATEINLRVGERASADLSLQSVAAARVLVHSSDPKRRPANSVQLIQQVFGNFEIPASNEQRPNGEDMVFANVAPGQYLARASAVGWPDGTELGEAESEIDVSGETTIDPANFATSATASLKGKVRFHTTSHSDHIIVLMQNQNGRDNAAQQVDDKGEFHFESIKNGTYEVEFAGRQGLFVVGATGTGAKINGHSVTIPAGASAELTVDVGEGVGEIRGVAHRGDRPVSGAMMLLVPEDPGENTLLFRRDQSDSDGSFYLQQVIPGKYHVIGIEDGWDLEWSSPAVLKAFLTRAQTIEVAAGRKYNVKVEVQNAAEDRRAVVTGR